MLHQSSRQAIIVICLLASTFMISSAANGVTILTGPTFTPAPTAPLAGALQLTTDTDSRVSVLVGDGTDFWELDFYDYDTIHSVPLAGFKPGRTNLLLVTVYDKDKNGYTAGQLLTFVTPSLPANFPQCVVLKSDPDNIEPGYILMTIRNRTANVQYIAVYDKSGNVVWYTTSPQFSASDVRQLDNGNFLVEEPSPGLNRFVEINLLGETVNITLPATGYPIDAHEAIVTGHGSILYLSDIKVAVSNFPSVLPKDSSNPNPSRTIANIQDNPVVEISTNGTLLNVWSPLNLLDPTRVSYLSGEFTATTGIDNQHANAIIDDTNSDSIIESLRAQNAVFKFSRDGQLKWILGPHEGWGTNWQPYLLTPDSDTFDWNYGQHAPSITPQGTLLLYNNGNCRAMPFDTKVADQDNYSSAVEYQIDETNMTVSEVWNSAWQTNQDRLFTAIVGKAQWLPQHRNVLVTYGYIHYLNGMIPPATNPAALDATMVRVIEYTHDPVPQIVFDLSFWDYNNTSASYLGYFCYRATQISDLYPHPVESVSNLTLRKENQIPVLQFSADPVHDYVIQASTNLIDWTPIGSPIEQGDVGDFLFKDFNSHQYPARFYRVISESQ